MATTADTDTLRSLAVEAYVHGYPLVAEVMGALTITDAGYGVMKPAPLNSFAHAAQLIGPQRPA
jgi:hypothetical protein